MMNTRRLVSFVVASTACLFPLAAEAALLAYDGFNYAPAGSDLLGNSGGFGGVAVPGNGPIFRQGGPGGGAGPNVQVGP